MSLSEEQQLALAVTPKFTAGLSVLCSSIVVWLILRDPLRRAKVYHRLILGISLTDVITSFWWVMSTWPIPEGTGVLWAVGNTRTCACQGFFLQVGIANPLYNLSLSFYYLLAVHWSWGEAKLRKYELFFHLMPLGWGITTALIGLPLKIFNNAGLWCWIADYPGRNENTSPYRWGIFYAPLWLAAVLVSYNLAKVVSYFWRLTLRTEKHVIRNPATTNNNDESEPSEQIISVQSQIVERASAHSDITEGEDIMVTHTTTGQSDEQNLSVEQRSSLRRQSFQATSSQSSAIETRFAFRRRQLLWQCLLYALVFYATWFPITLLRIFQAVGKPVEFPLLYAAAFLTPLQGLPNFLVYLYPIFVAKYNALRNALRTGGCRPIVEPQQIIPVAFEKAAVERQPEPPALSKRSQSTPVHFDLPPIEEEDEEEDQEQDETEVPKGEVQVRREEGEVCHEEASFHHKTSFVRKIFGMVQAKVPPPVSSLMDSQSDFLPEEYVSSPEGRWDPVRKMFGMVQAKAPSNVSSLMDSQSDFIPEDYDVTPPEGRWDPALSMSPHSIHQQRTSYGSTEIPPVDTENTSNASIQQQDASSALRKLLEEQESFFKQGQVKLWNADAPPFSVKSAPAVAVAAVAVGKTAPIAFSVKSAPAMAVAVVGKAASSRQKKDDMEPRQKAYDCQPAQPSRLESLTDPILLDDCQPAQPSRLESLTDPILLDDCQPARPSRLESLTDPVLVDDCQPARPSRLESLTDPVWLESLTDPIVL